MKKLLTGLLLVLPGLVTASDKSLSEEALAVFWKDSRQKYAFVCFDELPKTYSLERHEFINSDAQQDFKETYKHFSGIYLFGTYAEQMNGVFNAEGYYNTECYGAFAEAKAAHSQGRPTLVSTIALVKNNYFKNNPHEKAALDELSPTFVDLDEVDAA